MELTLLIPGVTATAPSTFNTGTHSDASGGRPFVNGNREQSNDFMLDGVDANRPNEPYLDPTAYSVPGPHTFGTAGVGIVRGPGMSRVDLPLNKQFRVTEHTCFQLHLAAFNATNTPIFQAPASLVITAPTFDQIRRSRSERNGQIVAKFYF